MLNLKTVIITWSNSWLGYETAKKIAKNKDFQIVLACRNAEKAETAKTEIINETGNEKVEVFQLDTSSLESVRDFVEKFKKLNTPVSALINNAWISGMHNGVTAEWFELVFATNYLWHTLLTLLLLPCMTDNAQIINITSDMHNPPMKFEWTEPENIAHMDESNRSRYAYSKLWNIYFTYELDERLRKINSKISVNAFNPGMMNTNFSGGHNSAARTMMVKLTMPERLGDLDKSSTALSEIILNEEYHSITWKYFDRSTNTAQSSPLSYDENNRKNLWDKTIEWIGIDKQNTIEWII